MPINPKSSPRTPTKFNLINELPTELLNLSLNKVDANNVIKVLLATKTLSVPEKKRNAPVVNLHNMKITNRFIDILIKLLSNTNIRTLSLYGNVSFEKDFDFSQLHRSELFANVKTLEIGNVRINEAMNRFITSCMCSPDTVKIDNISFNRTNEAEAAEAFVDIIRRFQNIDLELNNIDTEANKGFIDKIKELRMTTSKVIKKLTIDGATSAVFSFSRKDLRKRSSSSSS
uniref:Uncharacterized protein n=1 Tax=viral metagenome TaxID=1070528 RepID=A0A6C0LP51_9ZZZZ